MSQATLMFAFSAGMVAAVNPCGFALLPAYLSYYLGLESAGTGGAETGEPPTRGIGRALLISAALTAGFVVVFGLIGAIWTQVSSVLGEKLPWATVVIGVLIVILGIAMLCGFSPTVKLPKMDRGSGQANFWSAFLFGISYGVASLNCTIGPFLAAVTTTFRQHDAFTGFVTLVMYGLGMGALITALTVAVSFARQGFVRTIRSAIPYMTRVSGALLVASGAFAVYYGVYEARVLSGADTTGGPADSIAEWQQSLTQAITDIGPLRIGLVVLGVILAVWTAIYVGRARRHDSV
jgi:cytochrome c biogenesis protein CcdA